MTKEELKKLSNEELIKLAGKFHIPITKMTKHNLYESSAKVIINQINELCKLYNLQPKDWYVRPIEPHYGDGYEIEISAEIPIDLTNKYDKNNLIDGILTEIKIQERTEKHEKEQFERLKKKYGKK